MYDKKGSITVHQNKPVLFDKPHSNLSHLHSVPAMEYIRKIIDKVLIWFWKFFLNTLDQVRPKVAQVNGNCQHCDKFPEQRQEISSMAAGFPLGGECFCKQDAVGWYWDLKPTNKHISLLLNWCINTERLNGRVVGWPTVIYLIQKLFCKIANSQISIQIAVIYKKICRFFKHNILYSLTSSNHLKPGAVYDTQCWWLQS